MTSARSNRAARRRDHAEQRRRLGRMGAEAGGIWSVEIVRRGQHRPETLAAVMRWVLALRDRARGNHLCLCCDAEFGPAAASIPEVFCFLRPGAESSDFVSVSGICTRCATRSDEALLGLAFEAIRDTLMADARVLPAAHFHPDGGRA